jgi:GGDEF domain-containing protein
MHNTTEQKAKEAAKRLREVILSSKCRSEYGIDLSIGVSEYGGEAVHSLFKSVDRQMYLDKKKHKEEG